jgi:Arc/MetJ family transcription regulator
MKKHAYKLRYIMRTNIVIDDELMAQALQVTGLRTKKAVVERGLKTLIQLSAQQNIKALRGNIQWEGDLGDMRSNR